MGEAVWSDLLGQEKLVRRCQNMLATGHVPHAMLILAPPGSGKSTLADILSRALLCTNANPPCGHCLACRKIIHGNHADVIHRGKPDDKKTITVDVIDDIIRRDLSKKPFEGGQRVLILHDASKMRLESQNKFLKTLEEPPPNTYIILLCESLTPMLPTVLSRCALLRMQKMSQKAIAHYLTETYGIDSIRAQVTAAYCDGWPMQSAAQARDEAFWQLREDACTMLEELYASGGIFHVYAHLPDKKHWPILLQLWLSIFRDCLLEDEAQRIHLDKTRLVNQLQKRFSPESIRVKCMSLATAGSHLAQSSNAQLVLDELLLELMAQ